MICLRHVRSLGLLVTAALLGATAPVLAIWPFGSDDQWLSLEPLEQDRLATPIYNEALEAQAAGDRHDAIEGFEEVFRDYPGSRFAPDALYRTGELQMEREEWGEAFEAFQRLIRYYPDFPRFNEVIEKQFEIANAYEEGIGIRFLGLIPTTAPNRAVRVYEQVVANAPYSDLAPVALMRVALIHRREDEIIFAIDALDRLINRYPNSMLAGDAYLNLALAYASFVAGPDYDQGATREAISYLQDFLILFPNNPAVGEAEEALDDLQNVYARSKLVLGEFFYQKRGRLTSAKTFFNEAITIAPDSEAAQTARGYIARIDDLLAEVPEGQRFQPPSLWEYVLFWNTPLPGPYDADELANRTPPPPREPNAETDDPVGEDDEP